MADVIGEFLEKPGELHGEWRIADFLSLPDGVDKYYWSGKFFFSHAAWDLKIYPNGESELHSGGWIGLYLHRGDWGPPLTMSYSLGVKRVDGTEEFLFRRDCRPFVKERGGWGAAKFLERSDLRSRASDLVPAGALTITCNLRSNRLHSTDVSLCRRLWNTSLSLQDMLHSPKEADVTLRLKDGEIRAHKSILVSRSEVFRRMFSADMRESRTGEVEVEDAEEGAFGVALAYAYSGEPTGLSSKNVAKVYGVAHKYELEELTRLCAAYMEECLSVDTVCDVITVAEVYQESGLMGRAREFFLKNATRVVKTDQWKTLKRENSVIVSELLECILVENASKMKI